MSTPRPLAALTPRPLPLHLLPRVALQVALLTGALVLGGGCVIDSPPSPEAGPDAAELTLSGDALHELFQHVDDDGWSRGPRVETTGAFDRVGVMFDADTPVAMEVRSSTDGGETFGEWQPLEIFWAEEGAHNAYADMPEGGTQLEVRFLAPVESGLSFLKLVAFVRAEDEGVDLGAPAESEQALAADRIPVVSRTSWGARASLCGNSSQTPSRITIHHTETPNGGSTSVAARVRQVQSFHMDGRNYCDIGYHLLVGPDGQVYQGRYENKLGAHAGAGNNTNNVGISFIGSFMDLLPNESQLDAGAAAMRAVADEWGIALNRTKVKGHRELKATDCPGDTLYDYLSSLIALAQGGSAPTPPAPPPQDGCTSSTLGSDVAHDACVQVSYQACGLSSCAWYRCSDGAWQCTTLSACGSDSYAHGQCEGGDGDAGDGDGDGGGDGDGDSDVVGPIAAFPFVHQGNTSTSTRDVFDSYGCAPSKSESGPEVVYEVVLPTSGTLTARVEDASNVDVDVHILSALDPDACLDRHDTEASAAVSAGTVYVVADTFGSTLWGERPGAYSLTLTFVGDGGGGAVSSGVCAFTPTEQEMFWSSCASGMDGCYASGGKRFISLPATGPVVKEAHLVTTADGFGSSWPSTSTQGLSAHYTTSQTASGYVMGRTEHWAPAGEGGSQYGQGSTGNKIPVLDEAWYITMYWKQRPAGGTRMIVKNPANGRAVVASAGWETGPGATTSLAGVTEEIHHYLGTGHLSPLEVGFAADPSLPLGPIACASSGEPDPEPEPTDPDPTEPDPADPADPDPTTASYQDLPSSHPAYQAAEIMRARGAMWGCAPSMFCPDDPLRRDALANLIAANEHGPITLPSSPAFDDVGTSHWAYEHVQELSARQITFGCGSGHYCPGNVVSRASFAVYLRRALGLSGVSGSAANDVPSSHWAASSIKAVLQAGLMAGCGGGDFCPDAAVTKGEAALIALEAYP